MKVCLTGPSGSGKTTLANIIQNDLGLNFIPGSADIIISEEAREKLQVKYGYEPKGHANVRQMSANNIAFAYDFQKALLDNRRRVITSNDNFITDRSPIDNLAYYMDQVAHGVHEDITAVYIEMAKESFENLTHLIYIKSVNPIPIEDNGSRIANKYYQKKMNAIFEWVMKEYFMENTPVKFLTIDYWDLQTRITNVKEFLTT